MDRVRESAPQLSGLVPYDPKYLPARAMMSANESPLSLDHDLLHDIMREVKRVPFNRYPDPLANDLRDLIAEANGLDREQVLLGNGGDELLFDIALAWGGPHRTMINLPPTFSVYAANARLVGTEVVDIPRAADFSIDEQAVLDRVARGDIDYVVVTTPNNPTGRLAREEFIAQLLESTDALVVADEAYFEFSRRTVRMHLERHRNLVILRTFSKAFCLAGVRIGYVLGDAQVIRELVKVRQPYSVDAVSQAIARVVYANRAKFEPGIQMLIAERERMQVALRVVPGVKAYPSDSNYILVRLLNDDGSPASEAAAEAWQVLYGKGILVRDFSHSPMLEGCLRVSMGTPEQNDAFVRELKTFMLTRQARRRV
ncbi:histidinol-phosphate transaminase [Adlercreutzia sp. ZJ138]|uniref:histidinol-phosphate transaminase n=1 Tax=Adlercreutzia sp. ZJ138 TaxID=2709405 RepID=UPI0013EBE641|nr:histidinol-phosphate transaminase [Adlercreutzia sp. ZJ138]